MARGRHHRRATSRTRRRSRAAGVVTAVLGIVWALVAGFPVYYMIITSLKTQAGFFSAPLGLPPRRPTLANYHRVIFSEGITHDFLNSVIVTLVAVALALSLSMLAAYVIVRVDRRWVRWTLNLFLLGLAVPIQAVIIPVFALVNSLHIYDTLWALILPSAGFAMPITVLILANFFRDIPRSLFEAMGMEGASHLTILRRLVLPLALPAMASIGIYDAVNVWNNFLFPLVLTQSQGVQVLPTALYQFQGQFGIEVPPLMAAVVLSAAPLLVLYAVARRSFLRALAGGFV
jgi:raffinose/stachyose/melibiose transport system permease protein